jgi:uncharacterized OB-fold protein
MKLCGRCGELDLKPGRLCPKCGAVHEGRGTVLQPRGQRVGDNGDGNVRTSTKTPRQERDDT